MFTPFAFIQPTIVTAFDSDAQAFITAAAITDATQQTAINTLVVGLKADSLWGKMLAVYPFVGGTASQHKYNLKDPQNTNAAFRLNFSGSWTHTPSGSKPDGTTAYANTYFIPSASWTAGNSSISAYSRTNNSEAASLWGTVSGSVNLFHRFNSTSFNVNYHNAAVSPVLPASTTSAVNLISSRINTTQFIFAVNGATTSSPNTELSFFSSLSIYFGARNTNGSANFYSTRELAFAHIGLGLTTTQCTQLYNRIQAFQTTLGRQNP